MISKKAIVILYPGCIYFEVADFVNRISQTHQIAILSPDGKPVRVDDGIQIVADQSIEQASLANCDFVVLPGGDIYALVNHVALNQLLQTAYQSKNIVLGGICNGVVLLGQAGILSGKRCTHQCIEKYCPVPEFQELLDFAKPIFADSIYEDMDVVVDQQIVTAKPHAFREFAQALIQLNMNQ